MSGWSCSCDFNQYAVADLFSPEWHRVHRDIHLAAMVRDGVEDQTTVDNLNMLIERARRPAIGSEAAVPPVAASDRVAEPSVSRDQEGMAAPPP